MGYEQWRTWADDAEIKSEWVDGEVIVFMSTTIRHADVAFFVAALLRHYVGFLNLGRVLMESVEMRPADAARVPDILFVKRENLNRFTDKRLLGPADLIVEFVAEDSVERDREEKVAEYAAADVPEYWLIDARPGEERADFYRLVGGAYQTAPLDGEGRYHSLVLPGFWFRPDWLWQQPLPNELGCLAAIAPEAVRAALASLDAGRGAGA